MARRQYIITFGLAYGSGQPLSLAHSTTCLYPFSSAQEMTQLSQVAPSSWSHFNTCKWPCHAACRHDSASPCMPQSRAHSSTSIIPPLAAQWTINISKISFKFEDASWYPISYRQSSIPTIPCLRDRRRCLGRVREWSNTISYMKRCIRTKQLSSEGQRFKIEFKNKMKQEAGMARSRKRKTIQLVNVAAVQPWARRPE
jgi:hypothetical protein